MVLGYSAKRLTFFGYRERSRGVAPYSSKGDLMIQHDVRCEKSRESNPKHGRFVNPRMLSVLILSSPRLGRGGVEMVVRDVSRELSKSLDVTVALVGPSWDPAWERDLPKVVVGPLRYGAGLGPRALLRAIPWLHRTLAAVRPDVVVAIDPLSALLVKVCRPTQIRHQLRLLSWLHGDLALFPYTSALKWCVAHIVPSRGLARRLEEYTGHPAFPIGNPVSHTDGLLVPPPQTGTEVLYIGRLSREKRVDRLVRALSRVTGDWHCTIIGDGPEREILEPMAARIGAGRFTWTGWVSDPWSSVAQASVLVLTSESEGFGLVLLEAMVRGIPVCSVDCDFGPRDVIKPGENGWLLDPEDADALRARLQSIVSHTVEIPDAVTIRNSVQAFSAENVARAMMKVLERRADRLRGAAGDE